MGPYNPPGRYPTSQSSFEGSGLPEREGSEATMGAPVETPTPATTVKGREQLLDLDLDDIHTADGLTFKPGPSRELLLDLVAKYGVCEANLAMAEGSTAEYRMYRKATVKIWDRIEKELDRLGIS